MTAGLAGLREPSAGVRWRYNSHMNILAFTQKNGGRWKPQEPSLHFNVQWKSSEELTRNYPLDFEYWGETSSTSIRKPGMSAHMCGNGDARCAGAGQGLYNNSFIVHLHLVGIGPEMPSDWSCCTPCVQQSE